MAKTAGGEEAAAKGKPASSEPTNQVVTEDLFRKAVLELQAQAGALAVEKLKMKTLRENFRHQGIKLGILDRKIKQASMTRAEIREENQIEQLYASWLGMPTEGAKSSVGMSDEEVERREWAAIGRTYSRVGKPGRPPEECPPEFHQAFMRGFNEEDEAAWAEEGQQDQAQPKAPVVAQDHDQPSWSQYSPDPAEWFAAQKKEFQGWFDALPGEAVVRISHPGVLQAFRAARNDEIREEGIVQAERVAEAPRLENEVWPPAEGVEAPTEPVAAAPSKTGKAAKPAVH